MSKWLIKSLFFDRGISLSLYFFSIREQLHLFCCWRGKNMLLGFGPKSNLCSLFILCFFPHLFEDDCPPRLILSHTYSPDSPSSTIASQYIKLDGLITPSPSTGQLTEHKQWRPHLGMCGTQLQGENWGEISCSSSESRTTRLVSVCLWACVQAWTQSENRNSWLYFPLSIGVYEWVCVWALSMWNTARRAGEHIVTDVILRFIDPLQSCARKQLVT